MSRTLPLLGILLLLFGCIGCGEPKPKMYPVSGTVTLDNRSLAEGTVYFKTIATGAIDTLPVKDGKFKGQALEGKRRVEVVAYRLIPIAGEMGGEVQESLIARRYNAESTLTAAVTATGPNVYEFKVQSK